MLLILTFKLLLFIALSNDGKAKVKDDEQERGGE